MKGEEYNFWLCSIPGIGIRKLLQLETELGTPERIYRSDEERLEKIKGISARDAHNIVTSRQTFCPEQMKEELERLPRNILFCADISTTRLNVCFTAGNCPRSSCA